MKGHKAQRARRYFRKVHPWYFLVLTILFGTLCLTQLRKNNEGMIVRRAAVYKADKEAGDVEGALRELRSYVYSHMNTSLASGANAIHPPIQLKYTYERLQAVQQAKLGEYNSTLYSQALEKCHEQGEAATAQDTIGCIQNYASSRGVELGDIPDGLYKFDFTSAKWSPDLAGWSMIGAVLSGISFVLTTAYVWLLRLRH